MLIFNNRTIGYILLPHVNNVSGIRSSRTVPGAEEEQGALPGVDEGHLPGQLQTIVRLLPVSERLVRGVLVECTVDMRA